MTVSIITFLFGGRVIATMSGKKFLCWEPDAVSNASKETQVEKGLLSKVPIGITDRVLQDIRRGYIQRNVCRHRVNFIKKKEKKKKSL